MNVSGIILSGGRGRRAGGADKGLLPWAHHTRIEAVLQILRPQLQDIVISANRNLDQYQALGLSVVGDDLDDYQGPLAGIAACLPHCQYQLAVVVPCDSPELPSDLVARLLQPLADESIDLSYVFDGVRGQFLFAAIRQRCATSLAEYLNAGERSVQGWIAGRSSCTVDFSDQAQRFANHNELTK